MSDAAIYTDALLAELVTKGREESMVGWLCDPGSGTQADVLRTSIETWAAELKPRKTTVDMLRSGDDRTFWSGYWELAYARSFDRLRFKVDMRAEVDGKTPDFLASDGGLRTMVEVFSLGMTKSDSDEAEIMAKLTGLLQERIEFPTSGTLSLMSRQLVTQMPTLDLVDAWAAGLNRWLAEGAYEHAYIREEPFGSAQHWFAHRGSGRVLVNSAGKWLSDGRRAGERIADKITTYAPLVRDDLRLIVAIGQSAWTIDRDAIETALFGSMVVSWTVDPDDSTMQRDGAGVWVPGSPHQHEDSSRLGGVMVARSHVNESDRRVYMEPSFIHNPYSEHAFAMDTFTPFTEMQPQGENMTWVRSDQSRLLNLE